MTDREKERLCLACNESYLRTLPSGEWYCPRCGYEPEHADDCNVWVPTEWAGVDHLDPSRDCTCGATRWVKREVENA